MAVFRRPGGTAATEAALRRRCQAIVDGLELPDPFDIRRLAARLGERRGRPLHLIPLRLDTAPICGIWLSTVDFDAIFFETDTSPVHQEHIIAHELGHLLCGHRAGTISDDVARLLLPDLDPGLVRRALNRSNYTTSEEREAEMIASLLTRATSRRRADDTRDRPAAPPSPVAEVLARLGRTLEHRPRDRRD